MHEGTIGSQVERGGLKEVGEAGVLKNRCRFAQAHDRQVGFLPFLQPQQPIWGSRQPPGNAEERGLVATDHNRQPPGLG